jgi:hypothetical protein
MEQLSIQHLSTPRSEFYGPPSSSSSSYELRPGFIAMVRNRPFSGAINEDPYNHLQEFEELCLCLVIAGMTQETLRWKLFPFSLIGRVEQWYTHTIGSMNGDLEELRVDCCYSFSLTEHIDSLPIDVLSFEQLEKKSIGVAWARSSHLLACIPDLSIPDHTSLDIFCSGVEMKSTLDLDMTAGGLFAHKTLTKGREILDHLLENSSFPTDHNEPCREESESWHESL